MTKDVPEERLREALQATTEEVDPSPDAYARLAERLSSERFPPRQLTPGTAAFPAATSNALEAAAGTALVDTNDNEGGIFPASSPPPIHRSAEDSVTGPDGPSSSGLSNAEQRLPVTAKAGPTVRTANEPMDGRTVLGDPVEAAAARPDRVARANTTTTESTTDADADSDADNAAVATDSDGDDDNGTTTSDA